MGVRMVRITGRGAADYQFDADGLVTRGGQLGLTRDAVTGAITGDSVGVVATTRQYDAHGDLRRVELRVAGTPIYSQALTRDSVGRITTAADSSGTSVFTAGYRYDALDRLDQVSRDGVVSQQLSYDLAGNRLASTTNAGVVSATYATDDRLLTFGGNTVTHDSAGARRTEPTATDSLAYSYDDFGRLTSIARSEERRVGKEGRSRWSPYH